MLYVVGGLGLAYLIYGIAIAGNDVAPPLSTSSISILGGNAVGHRFATRSWSLHYDTLNASNDNTYIEALGIRDGAIYRQGKPIMHASAERATINLATHDFSISGNVHVVATMKGVKRTFDTDSATWTQSTQRLVMPGLIRLGAPGSSLKVSGVTVDAGTGHAKLGRVEGSLRP